MYSLIDTSLFFCSSSASIILHMHTLFPSQFLCNTTDKELINKGGESITSLAEEKVSNYSLRVC